MRTHWSRLHTVGSLLLIAVFVGLAIVQPLTAYQSWIVVMIGMVIFTMIVGHGITGVWQGALVDERLRMSLSRLQLLLWTILIVSAFATIAVMRMSSDAVNALNVGVPETIWALLGISATSLIGSPLIKNTEKNAPAPSVDRIEKVAADQGADPNAITVVGNVVKNTDINQASIADIFMGEYFTNFALLDLGKIQLFFFTMLLVISYGTAIGSLLRTDPMPSSLPDVGAGMLPLLGISHTGYLAHKVVTSPDDHPDVVRPADATHPNQ